MGDLQLYEELARHLDQGIIGSPKSRGGYYEHGNFSTRYFSYRLHNW
jgi:hypothetical protein